MSNIQNQKEEPEFDFWEFVACARCHLPFLPESGGPPSMPFWITECGHVICNNHLRPNQTCAKCDAQNIQVAPLQREMEAPMSNWFASVPHAFDAVAFATRFQIETLATLVRYYKRKYMQYRALIERLKADSLENKELKRTIEALRTENEQLRQYTAEPSQMINIHGKRPMLDVHRHPNGAHTNSSPRSVMTPLGPERLTLPPSHQHPSLSHRKHHPDDGTELDERPPATRPGSRRFAAEQYAYVAPRAQQAHANPAVLSHVQATPLRQTTQRHQMYGQQQEQAHTSMMPPSLPASLATRSAPSGSRQNMDPHPVRRSMGSGPNGPRAMPPPLHQPSARHPQLSGSLRPPPTPRDVPRSGIPIPERFVDPGSMNEELSSESLQSNRFMTVSNTLPTQRFVPTPSGRQRFSTPAPIPGPGRTGLVRTNTDLGSRASSRMAGSRQRIPFVPGGQNGFA